MGIRRVCEVRSPQRQTSENVFLIYKTARLPTAGLTSDGAKIERILELYKFSGRILIKSCFTRLVEDEAEDEMVADC